MNRIATRTALLGSGSLLELIGSTLLFSPEGFLAMSGVTVPQDPALMSELAAPASMLIIVACLMLIGGVKLRFADLGLLAGGTVYGSYGVGRVVSMFMHGLPSAPMIAAMLVEIGIGASLLSLWLNRSETARYDSPHAYPWELVV
jgi:hypothetical protein